MNITKLLILFVFVLVFHQLCEAQVTADFTADNTSGCQSMLVHFVNKSTPNTDSLRWNLGNGVSVKDSLHPGASYIIGSYTATLTAYKNGAKSTKSVTINVFKSPVAAFTVDKTKFCLPNTSSFTDLSTKGDGTITKWSWDMRNGDILTAQNPTYDKFKNGTFDVMLTVTDNNGCESSLLKSSYINVKDKPVVGFSANPSTACVKPVTVYFTNESTGPGDLTYNWDFGGSNTSTEVNPHFTYTSFGSYHVKLTATSDFGCSASLDVAAVSLGQVKAAGTISQNGKIIANNNAFICSGDLTYTDQSDNSSVLWDFGDGSFTDVHTGAHNLTNEGKNTIMLIASPGTLCSDTVKWVVNIESPTATFDFKDKICNLPLTVPFTNTSVNATNYLWRFPDGTTSTSVNTTYNFRANDNNDPYVSNYIQEMPITLIAKSLHGCTDSITNNITIHLPTAIIVSNSTIGCIPKLITFSSESLSDDPISAFEWHFGDGKDTITTTSTVSHTYSSIGNFTTNLIITSSADVNCKATSSNINILAGKKTNPDFTFSPASLCESGILTLTNTTPITDIDYGQFSVDGSTVPDFSFTNPVQYVMKTGVGNVPITLTTGNYGCYSSKSYLVENTGPIGKFNFTTDCANPLTYTFTGTIESIGATTYIWDFGDGVTDNSTLTPTHTYTTTGDKIITFTSSNNTCSFVVKQTARVRQGSIDFTAPATGCGDEEISFTAMPTNMQNELCRDKYLWKFGDNTPYLYTDNDVIVHQFSAHGSYSVKIIGLYENGCRDSVSKSIQIFKPQSVIFADPTTGCSPLVVTYTDKSTPDSNPLVKWDWEYGDGSVFSSLDAANVSQNIFYDNGSYITSLKVTDSNGCSDKATVSIGVATPDADFYADITEACSNKPITFNYTYENPDSTVWDFGDGTKFTSPGSSQLPIQHTYLQAKTYSVTLDIYKYNCHNSLPRMDYITVQNTSAHFTVSDSASTCYTKPISFDHEPSADISYGLWDFGDQNHTSDYYDHRAYTYPEPGNYTISLSIHTTFGCTDTFSKTIKITGPNGNFDISANTVCKGNPITLTAKDTVNLENFEWDLGDGRTVSGSLSPYQFTYNAQKDSGIKNVSIILHGHDPKCNPEKTKQVSVAMVTAGFVSPGSIVCSDVTIPFNNTSIGNRSQIWDFGDNTTSTSLSPTHIFNTGQYLVYLAVSDENSCKDTLKLEITVLPTPKVRLELDKSLCSQNKAILNAIGTTDNTIISWTPVLGLSDPNKFQTIATPQKSTIYKATLTYNGSSCFKSDSITVYRPIAHIYPHDIYQNVDCSKQIDTAKTTIGNIIYVDLCDSSDIKSWRWTPEIDIKNITSLNPEITAGHNITYMAILNEPNECFTDTLKVIVVIDTTNQTSHVPSAFRPGSDDKNNILYVKGRGISKIIEFKIYNRWGNVVFSTTDMSIGWDGKYQGKEQPIDTYIYTLKTEQFNGTITTEKGTILLLR